jgi:hypothetical protein
MGSATKIIQDMDNHLSYRRMLLKSFALGKAFSKKDF